MSKSIRVGIKTHHWAKVSAMILILTPKWFLWLRLNPEARSVQFAPKQSWRLITTGAIPVGQPITAGLIAAVGQVMSAAPKTANVGHGPISVILTRVGTSTRGRPGPGRPHRLRPMRFNMVWAKLTTMAKPWVSWVIWAGSRWPKWLRAMRVIKPGCFTGTTAPLGI